MANHPKNLETVYESSTAGRTFLLRCWQEMAGEEQVWRFTLVQMGSGQVQRGFASLEAVMEFLNHELRGIS